MSTWQAIARHIGEASGQPFAPRTPDTLSGGCINSAYRLEDGARRYFVKTNRADRLAMFEAEADGLCEMADTATIGVPRALCTGVTDGLAYIVMDYVPLGPGGATSWQTAGRQLAALHGTTAAQHGWRRDNTIGSTRQDNTGSADWATFWRDRRLGFQLEEAARNGHRGRLQSLGDRLMAQCGTLLDHAPPPSLLHGDLWAGNIGFAVDGAPLVYDPATYYGDREADIAMTELFGGFGADFYAAYREAWPLDDGYRVRKDLYNLYHVLNHLNLFGGGYGAQAERMMGQLLSLC